MSSSASRVPGYREGVRTALPLGVAVFGFGVAFGLLARSIGLGSGATIGMSATTFAGSAQFAAVSVLAAGGALPAAIAAAVLLNLRYLPVGISVASELPGPWWRRLVEGQLVVDESWAIAHLGGGRYDRRLLVGAGLVLYGAWVTGTALGAVGGLLVGDPRALGLDAAFPALFLALLVPQLIDRRAVLAAVAGGLLALVLVPLTPPGVPIVAASAATLLGLRR